MQLKRIRITNYRLLVDAELDVDPQITLIVGRNNTAKTSCFELIKRVLDGVPFIYNDYPLSKRDSFHNHIESYMKKEIDFETLCNTLDTISIEFLVDYSIDDPYAHLGALSPFIIDVDENISTALIRAEYRVKPDEKALWNALESSFYNNGSYSPTDDAREKTISYFSNIFDLTIYAVNPRNPKEKQIKTHKELRELFPIQLIPAERLLGEDGTRNSSLSSLISDFFNPSDDELDPVIIEKVKELRQVIEYANKSVQHKSDEILSDIVNKAIGFGYPNKEELQLGVITRLCIDEEVKNQTELSYTLGSSKERLPSTHNGLGYKNLIKMEFLLATFAKIVEKCGQSCIPLLFIEEPESHMHPQMQQAFADYLESYLKKTSSVGIQTLLSSHSAHIANTMPFSKIRYAQKTANGVIYKNLNIFTQGNKDNVIFIQKYLTLTRCDLFFADKAILVEGASERIMLPDMIQKCSQEGMFSSRKYELPAQYYSIIEVGGAYAYLFIPFMEFLGIPCLIITDIDPVANKICKDGKKHLCSVVVSKGETTSNETIKWWYKHITKNHDDAKVPFDQIMKLSATEKTINKCHIEYQTTERELCGHSFEESIRNVNRSFYGLGEMPTEEELEFDKKSKTDFALNLILNCEHYTIPSYIKTGLVWLNEQTVLE